MKTSVIIPTYNGRCKVGNVLRALARQTHPPHEVIVVIDGSTDGTATYLAETGFGLPFAVHTQENRGRAAVRNKGAQLATGDLLVFFDDDMRPEPDCLVRHLHHHAAFPGSILVGAQLEEPAIMRTDIQRYKAHLSRKWARPFAGATQPESEKSLYLTAAHCSMFRPLFERLGGFDERLTDAEDYDLAVRAYQAGVPIYCDQGIVAWHDDFITCRSYVKRLRQYRMAHYLLKELKPETYRVFNQYDPHAIKASRRLLYSLVSRRWLVTAIDRNYLAFLLPARLRFKLYDVVTTGLSSYFSDRPI